MFRNLTLGAKILMGFVVILVILGVLSIFTIFNITQIVANANEVISGNKITGTIIEKKVDHQEWAAALNEFIMNSDVDTLTINTDPQKCGFGKWYYSSERTDAEEVVPQISSILKLIEEPHDVLHQSARKIAEKYVDIDPAWSGFFAQKEKDHYAWMNTLLLELMEKQNVLSVQMNYRECEFGKFLYGSEIKELEEVDTQLASYFEEIKQPHKLIHDSAQEIQNILSSGTEDRHERAFAYFRENTVPKMEEVKVLINDIIERIDTLIASYNEAKLIYNTETAEALNTVKGYFDQIVDTTKQNVMTMKLW